MNPRIGALQPYPFEKLRALFAGVAAAQKEPINMGIGEPRHSPPDFVLECLERNMGLLAKYPATKGVYELREAIADWLVKRFGLHNIDAESQVLPVAGTREALFSFAQAVVDTSTEQSPLVLSPNPFYQIYEGAALLAGAQPHFLPCLAENDFIPDYDTVSDAIWQRCQVLYLCTPGNPSGTLHSQETLQKLIELAERFDFIIASDECYSELYFDEAAPPVGLLEAAQAMGNTSFKRCVVFHSLSKRSNLPGLRSGFVAGDAEVLALYLKYRTYQGCALPVPTQMASIVAWQDETHVIENRALYREKFILAKSILGVDVPPASFYVWLKTPNAETDFAKQLYNHHNVTVLPGSFLSRSDNTNRNPGSNRVRIALVANQDECETGLRAIADTLKHIGEGP